MHRTVHSGATARDPAATVAPLRRLYDAANTATGLARCARAAELHARAVAAVEAALDGGGAASLIVATLLREQFISRGASADGLFGTPAAVGSACLQQLCGATRLRC
jgi:hypothetical protein